MVSPARSTFLGWLLAALALAAGAVMLWLFVVGPRGTAPGSREGTRSPGAARGSPGHRVPPSGDARGEDTEGAAGRADGGPPRADASRVALPREDALHGRVLGESGEPIEGAEVAALPLTGLDPLVIETEWFAFRCQELLREEGPRTVTDTQGRYLLPVPPGPYLLHARAEGFLPQGHSILLEGGPHEEDLNLARGAVLAGLVTDTRGRPIEGATILASASENCLPVPEGTRDPGAVLFAKGLHDRATVDASGRFRLRSLHRCPHVLTVSAPGFATETTSWLFPGNEHLRFRLARGGGVEGRVTDLEGRPLENVVLQGWSADGSIAGPMTWTREDGRYRLDGLRIGRAVVKARAARHRIAQHTDVPIAARTYARVDFHLDRGGEVSGRVLSPAGEPVDGARVQGHLYELYTTTFPARSDARGRFRIGGLPEEPVLLVTFNGADFGWVDARVWAQPGEQDVVLRLAEGGTITGRALAAEEDHPIERFTVRLFLLEAAEGLDVPGDLLAAEPRRFEDPAGAFRISGIPPGTYGVRVAAAGRAPRDFLDLRVEAGATLPPLVARLARGRTLRGRIVDGADLLPVAGARVRALERWGDDALDMPSPTEVRTDALGVFELQGLASPSADLRITHPGHADRTVLHLPVPDPPPAEPLEIRLAPVGRIEGVVHREDGEPHTSCRITCWIDGTTWVGQRGIVTDEEGFYRLDGLQPGSYAVAASLGPESVMTKIVDVEAAGTTRLDFVTAGSGGVQGRVLAGGSPLPYAEVLLRAAPLTGSAERFYVIPCDAEGRFAEEGLVPGSYALSVDPGWGFRTPTLLRADVAPGSGGEGGAAEILVDVPAGRVEGVVRDRVTLEAIHDARVALLGTARDDLAGLPGAGAPCFGETRTDASGGFAVQPVVPGTYSLAVEARGHARAQLRNLSVDLATIRRLDVRLEPEHGTLTVRVEDPEGAMPLRAWVAADHASAATEDGSAADGGGTRVESWTNESGRVALEHLPAGELTLVAAAAGFAPSAPRTVRVEPGTSLEVVLRLRRGAILEVQTRLAPGGPVAANVPLRLEDATGRTVRVARFLGSRVVPAEPPRTDARGTHLWRDLPPGDYVVVAVLAGTEVHKEAHLAGGAHASLEIAPPPMPH